jgi:hypothetical protein
MVVETYYQILGLDDVLVHFKQKGREILAVIVMPGSPIVTTQGFRCVIFAKN